ncbi:MAG: hypothetical protein ACO1O6_04155 [Bacteroidota bacterium]
MRTALLLISAALLTMGISFRQSQVFYCDSPNGKKYHFSKKCRGLQKCTHTIRQTNVLDAKKMGLTVCLVEK